jgi:hypothetical protein
MRGISRAALNRVAPAMRGIPLERFARHGRHHFAAAISFKARMETPGNRLFMSGTNDRTLLMKTTGPGQWTEVAFSIAPEDYL